MKKLSLVLVIFLAGCAASPEKLNAVAVEESARLPKPSKPLSAFSSYELKPFILSAEVTKDADKVEQAAILEKKVKEMLAPLFAEWSAAPGPGRSGTLIIQPQLMKLRIVSGGARFWAGALVGQSTIDLDLRLTDGTTNDVIAKPRIARSAGAMTGAWSIGKSDDNLHDYIAHIVREYLSRNYKREGQVSGR